MVVRRDVDNFYRLKPNCALKSEGLRAFEMELVGPAFVCTQLDNIEAKVIEESSEDVVYSVFTRSLDLCLSVRLGDRSITCSGRN